MELQIQYEFNLTKYRLKTEALFHALKEGITSGGIAAGFKLPSSRQLAATYGLSRGTVNVVYEMLQSQGFIKTAGGSGTYVIYDARLNADADLADPRQASLSGVTNSLSEWGKRLSGMPLLRAAGWPSVDDRSRLIDFSLSQVDLAHFPTKDWNRCMFEQVRLFCETQRTDAFESDGHGLLKESIALHLRKTRGISVLPGDIVIVNGSHQALMLLIQLLIDPGDAVAVENPHYLGISRAVLAAGGCIQAFPVDTDGIVVNTASLQAKLLVVTPSRQYPTGAVLPMERRLRLLKWAEETGAYIIEDDYDSEFRHKGRPIEPLKALDRTGRVAYIGTFSRTMLPDIRLGYAVLPSTLVASFRTAKQLFETHPSSILEQRALAAFMKSGLYERHLRRMRRIYKSKAELIAALLRDRLAPYFNISESDAGLHVYAAWKRSSSEFDEYIGICDRLGVRFYDTRPLHIDRIVPSACFGFAHLDEEHIAEGVDRLIKAASLL